MTIQKKGENKLQRKIHPNIFTYTLGGQKK